MTNLQFRTADSADSDTVVPLIYEASHQLFDHLMREPSAAHAFLRHDFLRGDGLFGHRNQVVGVTPDGAVAVTCTLYPGRLINELTRETVRSALSHFGAFRMIAIGARARGLKELFIEPRHDGMFLANACVTDQRRGEGLFAAAVAHAVERTRAAGLVAIQLDVGLSNTAAFAAYERLGFRVAAERIGRNKDKLDGFRRMELAV